MQRLIRELLVDCVASNKMAGNYTSRVKKTRWRETVPRVFSKDCRLPVQLQRAMAAEAEAAREARAKVGTSSL